MDILPDLVWHLEEPIADEAALPLYFLSSMAKEHVKVVLAGDGGDELFVGYNRYFLYQAVSRYTQIPGNLRKRLVEPLIRGMPRLDGNGQAATFVRRAKKLLEVAYQPEELGLAAGTELSHRGEARALLGRLLACHHSRQPIRVSSSTLRQLWLCRSDQPRPVCRFEDIPRGLSAPEIGQGHLSFFS